MPTNEEIDQQLAEKNAPSPINLVRPGGFDAGPKWFAKEDLSDQAFFKAHKNEILDAARHGRILVDVPAPRERSSQAQMDAARAAARKSIGGKS
jgi:hypothetical protein